MRILPTSLHLALAAACLVAFAVGCSAAEAADTTPQPEPVKVAPAKEDPPPAPPATEEDRPDVAPPSAGEPRPEPPPAEDKRPEPPPAGDRKPSEPALGKTIGVVKDFPAGTPDAVLRQAFRCALDMGESEGFDCYVRLNVEINRDNENAIVHLRNYQWRYFRQRAPSYVVGTSPFAITITRRDAPVVEAGKTSVKLFLKSDARDNPAPITFRWEGNEWRIYSNSL